MSGVGCSESDDDPPATPDGAPDAAGDAGADAGVQQPGVTIAFAYLGPGRAPVSGDERIVFDGFSIKEMAMQLHEVEIIADTVDDGEQVFDSRALEYPWSSAPRINFPTAPPGVYSWIRYRVEKTDEDEELPDVFRNRHLAIRVIGEARVVDDGGEEVEIDFEYADDRTIDISLGFEQRIEQGTIAIELDLEEWFSVVDWQVLADQASGGDGGDEDDDGDTDGERGGPGPGGGDGGPDGGDDGIVIGLEGDQETAAQMRTSLRRAFEVRQR
jgi:hypothetical protein